MDNIHALYRLWREKTAALPALRDELDAIGGDDAAIEDRFYRDLAFGTGGLRGVIGAGTNRMNVFTVGKATQGYANYLKAHFAAPSVAIAYDSRINSRLFAETAAGVFAANGIRVHIYDRLMPTPSLSFAVRDLRCSGGCVITASHNPAKYNGYKVYGPDGCQITTDAAAAIQSEIDHVDPFADVRSMPFSEALSADLAAYIGADTVERYLAAVSGASLLPEGMAQNASIVYTPLNGTGISCVPHMLRSHGFTNLLLPPEQAEPDGNFPTCPYPNPEIREALAVGLRLAEETGSELLLATDPDCDRVGAAVKTENGYRLISGNEMGVLLLDFVCRMRRENHTMPERPVAVKTIVTTPMAEKIAAHYGVELRNVLTGFKFIGEQIGRLEKENAAERFIFGFEESYGYLSGSFVRDKDAVNASLLICEMFVWYKAQGKTLADALDALYAQYGFYETKLLSFAFEGSAGFAHMTALLDSLRSAPPAELGGGRVTATVDYDRDETGLPRSNVLRFVFSGGEAVVRPSGTEPKLKIYLTAVRESRDASRALLDALERQFTGWAK